MKNKHVGLILKKTNFKIWELKSLLRYLISQKSWYFEGFWNILWTIYLPLISMKIRKSINLIWRNLFRIILKKSFYPRAYLFQISSHTGYDLIKIRTWKIIFNKTYMKLKIFLVQVRRYLKHWNFLLKNIFEKIKLDEK